MNSTFTSVVIIVAERAIETRSHSKSRIVEQGEGRLTTIYSVEHNVSEIIHIFEQIHYYP